MFITNVEKTEKFLINIYKFLTLSGYVKAFAFFQICTALLLLFFQSAYFIHTFDIVLFLKYAPLYFASIYLLFTNVIYLIIIKVLQYQLTSFRQLFSPSLNNVSKMTKAIIKREIRKVNFYFAFQLLAAFSTIIPTLVFWNVNIDDYVVQFLGFYKHIKNDSVASVLVRWILYTSFILLAIPTVAIPIYFKYVVFHMKTHTFILVDAVYQLDKKLSYYEICLSTPLKKYYKSSHWEYNEYVFISLKKLVKKHVDIIGYSRVLQKNQLLYVVYIFNGIMIGFTSTFGFFSPLFKWYHVMPMAMGFLAFAYPLCNYCQELEDLGTQFSNALFNLNWYKWDIRCQKVYLVLFTYSINGILISIFSWFAINKVLFRNVIRILYTVGSFLRSLEN